MNTLKILTKRNVKLFFHDKGLFFTALITPVILLVLYILFLSNVYRETLLAAIPVALHPSPELVNAYVGGQLISSILAVSCVTVAFCSNMLMVQDKARGTLHDLCVAPLAPNTLAVSYYLAALVSTLIVCLCALCICLGYVAVVGWYLSVQDVLALIVDVILLVSFGTAISSLVNVFLSTQGQISAVGSAISSGYGFLCGAYMPLSQFSPVLQRVLSFLPGTHATVLVRNHAMRGVLEELERTGFPSAELELLKDGIDCNLYFFDRLVSPGVMYLVVVGSTLLLLGGYVLVHLMRTKRKKRA